MEKKKNIFTCIDSAQIDEISIDSERELMSQTQTFRKNLIRHLFVIEALEEPTQGRLADWYSHFTTKELVNLCKHGRHFYPNPLITAPVAVNGQCHAVTALTWFLNETLGDKKENLSIYTGVSCKAFSHSWLYYEETGVVVEPTHIDRENYFGYKVEDPMGFFITELNQIFFLIKEGDIPASIASYFETEFKKYFEAISYSHLQLLEARHESND